MVKFNLTKFECLILQEMQDSITLSTHHSFILNAKILLIFFLCACLLQVLLPTFGMYANY